MSFFLLFSLKLGQCSTFCCLLLLYSIHFQFFLPFVCFDCCLWLTMFTLTFLAVFRWWSARIHPISSHCFNLMKKNWINEKCLKHMRHEITERKISYIAVPLPWSSYDQTVLTTLETIKVPFSTIQQTIKTIRTLERYLYFMYVKHMAMWPNRNP